MNIQNIGEKTNGSEDELLIDCNPIAEKYDYFDFGDYDIPQQ